MNSPMFDGEGHEKKIVKIESQPQQLNERISIEKKTVQNNYYYSAKNSIDRMFCIQIKEKKPLKNGFLINTSN